MGLQTNAEPEWFTIFRTDEDNAAWLYKELFEGRLRQGWGAPGLGLTTADGEVIEKPEWESAYRERTDWGDPSPRRFAILRRMVELDDGDIVVMPKMPAWDRFSVVRVSGRYGFETADGVDDFGHVVPVHPDSVRTFSYGANDDAFLVSALFSRANHWPAVSSCVGVKQVAAVRRLLEMPDRLVDKPRRDLLAVAMDEAFRVAAESLAEAVTEWNGPVFEAAVKQRFVDQGYEVKAHRRYDGKGADMDMVVSPPPSPYGPFLPTEIAVQVKWKQGIDDDDARAVEQIDRWSEWQGSTAAKYVISSASDFTEKAREEAAANGVELIGGLQTMCFLLGLADRYRADWEAP